MFHNDIYKKATFQNENKKHIFLIVLLSDQFDLINQWVFL